MLKKMVQKGVSYLPTSSKAFASEFLRKANHQMKKIQLHGFLDMPVAVDLETYGPCNRSCFYCPREQSKDIMSMETIEKVVSELKEWDFKGRISPHSYNEPLLDKRIFSIINYIAKELPNNELSFFTNSDFLYKETVNSLLDAGTTSIVATLHEPSSPELVDRVRSLAKQYTQILVNDLRTVSNHTYLGNRGGQVSLEGSFPKRLCIGIDVMVIRADSSVPLCCDDAKKKYVLGNVKEQSLPEIWNSYASLRKQIRKGNFTLDLCKNCGYII